MLSKRFICAVVPVFALAACSGSSPDGANTSQSALTGPVQLRASNNDAAVSLIGSTLVAAQVAGLSKIVVSVARVEAKVDVDTDGRGSGDDAWVTVASGPFSLDLLSLDGGTLATLGVAKLPAGDVDSLRLVLGGDAGSSYVVTSAGATMPLVVPSGDEAGIRVTGDFDAQACATGQITLEFAARHSIEVHPDGDGDAYVLRPVVRVSEATIAGACASSPTDAGEARDEH